MAGKEVNMCIIARFEQVFRWIELHSANRHLLYCQSVSLCKNLFVRLQMELNIVDSKANNFRIIYKKQSFCTDSRRL